MLVFISFFSSYAQVKNKNQNKSFTESFKQESCSFINTGRNQYFILEPGYQLILEGMDGKEKVKLVITVLNKTKKIGNVETRIVEENESVNGKTTEISRNFFAICKETGNVFYFGEEVDIYKNGKVVSHEGAWIAEARLPDLPDRQAGGQGKNKAGIMMPGQVIPGDRYYQEIAPGVAMDRAEIVSVNEKLKTPADSFNNCVKVEETTPLEPKAKEYKIHAPGIGLIRDGNLQLITYGFKK